MLKRLIYILLLFLMLPFGELSAQGVLIGRSDNATNPYAKLEVYSTNSGFLMPRLSRAQRLAMDPDEEAVGLLVYDLEDEAFMYFNGEYSFTLL